METFPDRMFLPEIPEKIKLYGFRNARVHLKIFMECTEVSAEIVALGFSGVSCWALYGDQKYG